MTSDQRLDQLEPLVSQTLAVADRHTAQLKQIIGILSQQSENTEFLLKELIKVKEKQVTTDAKIEAVDAKIETVSSTLGTVSSRIEAADAKIDRILDLLSGSK